MLERKVAEMESKLESLMEQSSLVQGAPNASTPRKQNTRGMHRPQSDRLSERTTLTAQSRAVESHVKVSISSRMGSRTC